MIRARALTRAGTVIGYRIHCIGCDMPHVIYTAMNGMPAWGFNGDIQRPTFTPSLLCKRHYGPEKIQQVCHSHITDGRMQFLDDCTHAYAGKVVDLPELEAWDSDDD